MHPDASVLILINLAAIGALPRVFFRKDGRFNRAWWLTAAPFFVSAAVHAALLLELTRPLVAGTTATISSVMAVPFAAASIGLIGMTVGCHRVPLALWHQRGEADNPAEIVTWGPYRWVRHPFYTAFLMALVAALLAGPHPVTLATLVYGVAALTVTARREERRLSASSLGDSYRSYASTTGRFVPRLWSAA